jgi:hypothetical protein
MKYYVAYKAGGKRALSNNPDPEPGVWAKTGPFRTKGAAQIMLDGGIGNPHTATVAQCEKIYRRRNKNGP